MSRKRGNREGSIRRRADGRWEGRIMLGYRPDGKPYRKTVYGKTRQEVAEKLARLAGASTVPADPSQVTLGQYIEQWLEHHCEFGGRDGHGLRWGTRRLYRQDVRLHLLPYLGTVRLSRLTPQHIKTAYIQLAENGVSQHRIAAVHSILNSALQAAVIEGLIPVNPCSRLADKPHRNGPKDLALTKEQAAALLAATNTGRPNLRLMYLPILLGLAAGLRAGEVCGLRWCDVDLEAGVIHVRHQYSRGSTGRGLHPLKTSGSLRSVPLPDDVVEVLKHWKHEQKVANIEGFVCTRARGVPWKVERLDDYFAQVRARAKLPVDVKFHTLRHTYTTWLAEAGVNPRVIAALLGHTQLQTTLRVYQSVTQAMVEQAREAVAGLVKPVGVKLGSNPLAQAARKP